MNNDKGKTFRFKEVDYSFSESQTDLERGIVYVCKLDEIIEFICPCGCNAIIMLNTIKDTKPCWKFVPPNSITPSIDRQVGCKSHFTITNGITH